MTSRPPFEVTVRGLNTKSDKIRALARAGYLRTEISKLLEIRYQHVRKVLLDAGIKRGLTKSKSACRQATMVTPGADNTKAGITWRALLKAGFKHIGYWTTLDDGTIAIKGEVPTHPGVYALVLDESIVYVGLTLSGLRMRMSQYRLGHKGQRTSARLNGLIRDSLANGRTIKVFIARPTVLKWRGLPVNAAPGLEASLIELIRPAWNIHGARRAKAKTT